MSSNREDHTLVYHRDSLQPEDLLIFIELEYFCDSWENYDLTDEDLAALQIFIMCDPKGGDVIPGTKGLRKLRYSPENWNIGKRGALRVCYVYFEQYGWVLLALVFKKNELENISASGKKAINKAIDEIEKDLKQRYGF